jgi:hypothetical protein
MNIFVSLGKKGKIYWLFIALLILGIVGILDFVTGYELTLSIFYTIPIALVTWLNGRKLGIIAL